MYTLHTVWPEKLGGYLLRGEKTSLLRRLLFPRGKGKRPSSNPTKAFSTEHKTSFLEKGMCRKGQGGSNIIGKKKRAFHNWTKKRKRTVLEEREERTFLPTRAGAGIAFHSRPGEGGGGGSQSRWREGGEANSPRGGRFFFWGGLIEEEGGGGKKKKKFSYPLKPFSALQGEERGIELASRKKK